MGEGQNKRYDPLPRPWRVRLSNYATMIDHVQDQIEEAVGWNNRNRKYRTFVYFEIGGPPQFRATLVGLLRSLMPDIKSIEVQQSLFGFEDHVKIEVAGKKPSLRRKPIHG